MLVASGEGPPAAAAHRLTADQPTAERPTADRPTAELDGGNAEVAGGLYGYQFGLGFPIRGISRDQVPCKGVQAAWQDHRRELGHWRPGVELLDAQDR